MFGGMSMLEIMIHLALFLIVQALVYFILTNSSNVFSTDTKLKSFSFKLPRSTSIRRIVSLASDLPSQPSPTQLSPPVFLHDPCN
ncbi:hypothetical protein vseg_021739 [Gypsophila vaccaria]